MLNNHSMLFYFFFNRGVKRARSKIYITQFKAVCIPASKIYIWWDVNRQLSAIWVKLEAVRMENIIYIPYQDGMATSKYKYLCKYFKAELNCMTETSVWARIQIVT